MRVLWFTNTPSRYASEKRGYNGGGWISSLEKLLSNEPNIELGVCFFMNRQPFKKIINGVTYYPLVTINDKWKEVKELLGVGLLKTEKRKWRYYEDKFIQIINDFNPDVIHVFGTEQYFGLVSTVTKIPVIIHLQGLLNPCFNAFLPPGFSVYTYLLSSKNPISILRKIKDLNKWEVSCIREKEILKRSRFFFGRTEWDNIVSKTFSPNARYFHCNEVLRDEFYKDDLRQLPSKLTIVTTISRPLYKGFDIVLKTAKILTEFYHIDYEWRVFGNINPLLSEKVTKIETKKYPISLKGVASAETLKNELLKATVYVHTSYIDNSPNSVCEAQILGCPCIATYIGGIPSLIKEHETGYMIPANDPYKLAYDIYYLYINKEQNIIIGNNGRIEAFRRHDRSNILNSLIQTYETIIKND